MSDTSRAAYLKMRRPPAIKNLVDPYKADTITGVGADATWNDHGAYWTEMFRQLKEQEFELSQFQINTIGNHLFNEINAIDMPYIFRDHDHVSSVLDGAIGQFLSKEMSKQSGVTSLGYTYSGGYRVLGATDSITCLDDLSSRPFVSSTSPSNMLFEKANIKHISGVSATADDIGDMNENGGAIETTYLRFAGKHVLKTNHSMFMTAILASNNFLDTLTAEQVTAFKEAGAHVAKVERAWSINDAAKYEQDAKANGVTIVTISEQDDLRLREAAKELYKAENVRKLKLNPNLVKAIIETNKTIH
jgi:C4-dicarboxylate-binding protein DctP